MRWLLVLLIILLAAWRFLPRPEPVPVEESFIAEPVRQLRGAEAMEQSHLQEAEARKRRLEEATDGGG
jgi:hypothetical protein